MVGVLIIVGIIGYGLVYSGLSQLPNPVVTPPQGTLEALWPGHGQRTAGPIPRARGSAGSNFTQGPRAGGRQ